MYQKTYYTVIGKAIKGTWAGKYVVVGSLKENMLAESEEQAEEFLVRAARYISSKKNPEIDVDTLRVAYVSAEVDAMPSTKINL